MDAFAQQVTAPVCVAVHAAAHRSRRARPGFKSRESMADCPAHQPIDGQRGVGANLARRDFGDATTTRTHDETTNARVGYEDVRSASQHGDRHADLPGVLEHDSQLIARRRFDEEIRRPSDSKRRERSQRGIRSDSPIAEPGDQRALQRFNWWGRGVGLLTAPPEPRRAAARLPRAIERARHDRTAHPGVS